jgi:hypothetical protein
VHLLGTVLNTLAAVLAAMLLVGVVEDLTGQFNVIVCELANLSIIDTEDLSLLRGTEGEARDEVHDEEDEAGTDKGVCATGDGIGQLVTKLDPVVVDPSTGDDGEAIEMCYVVSSEEGGQDVANETSNGVLGEDIKSIINAEDELELSGVVGTGGTENTVDDGGPGWDETRARSNGNESSNDTGAETDSGPLAFKTVIKDTPLFSGQFLFFECAGKGLLTVIPPTQAAKLVTTAAMTARMLAARAEPALNPNHPTHRKTVPITM